MCNTRRYNAKIDLLCCQLITRHAGTETKNGDRSEENMFAERKRFNHDMQS